MAGLSGVGSGAVAASGSAKTAPAASTVDALSMSRLESLLSRMFGPAPVDWMRPHIDCVHEARNSAKTPRATLSLVTSPSHYLTLMSVAVSAGHRQNLIP